MTLEAYKFSNPESIIDRMRREEEAAAKWELKQKEVKRKHKARKHAKQVKIAMGGRLER